jgi:ParB-like chromosome segregation protein Spo0J
MSSRKSPGPVAAETRARRSAEEPDRPQHSDPTNIWQPSATYQVMPPLSAEEYVALKNSIAAEGVLVPVVIDENGVIIDGHSRVAICEELGITDWPKVVRSGLSEIEKRTHARTLNFVRRFKLTREQIRQIIADQIKDTPDWSNNRIGIVLGVDDKTVASVRADLEATSEIPKLKKRVGADGKTRKTPTTKSKPFTATAKQKDAVIALCSHSRDDVKKAGRTLVAQAQGGEKVSAVEVLERVARHEDLDPKPAAPNRLELLEALLERIRSMLRDGNSSAKGKVEAISQMLGLSETTPAPPRKKPIEELVRAEQEYPDTPKTRVH